LIIPPFWGRKPTGGVGDLPLSKCEPLGESIVECSVSGIRGCVDDRMGNDECCVDGGRRWCLFVRKWVVCARNGRGKRQLICDVGIRAILRMTRVKTGEAK